MQRCTQGQAEEAHAGELGNGQLIDAPHTPPRPIRIDPTPEGKAAQWIERFKENDEREGAERSANGRGGR